MPIFDIVSELLRFNVSKNRRLITLLSVVFVCVCVCACVCVCVCACVGGGREGERGRKRYSFYILNTGNQNVNSIDILSCGRYHLKIPSKQVKTW